MSHTKEPWRVHGDVPHRVVGAHSIHEQIAVCERGYSGEGAANAARIVACVNACAGINPEAVPDLLAACESVLPQMEIALAARIKLTGIATGGIADKVDALKKAIAKAKGDA